MGAHPLPTNRASFTGDELRLATGGTWLVAPSSELAIVGVSTDTRAVTTGNVFVALSGERFDGHRFVAQAIAGGARALIVERAVDSPAGVAVLQVANTRAALGALAHFHRRRWTGKLLAIGGSAGKTTTRRAVAAVLERHRPGEVHSTEGNFNNDIGVPLTLLGLTSQHHFAVVEIGTNHRGEVAALAQIAAPDLALLTIIGAEHTEGFGTIEEVAAEEGDLYAALPADGIALGYGLDTNIARQLLTRTPPGARRITWGNHEDDVGIGAFESLGLDGTRFDVWRHTTGTTESMTTPLLGTPGCLAAVAAIASCEAMLGTPVDLRLTERGLADVLAAADGRLTVRHTPDGVVWIDDSYNANPPSMASGIDTAAEIAAQRGARLLLVLGEMRELGAISVEEHRSLRVTISRARYQHLLAVAGDARELVVDPARDRFVDTAAEAALVLRPLIHAGDVVLLKGSRGVGLERILQSLYPAAFSGSHKEHAS